MRSKFRHFLPFIAKFCFVLRARVLEILVLFIYKQFLERDRVSDILRAN